MITIPYGHTGLDFDESGCQVLKSRTSELRTEQSGLEIVRAAMDAPVASPSLKELAKGKNSCVIIISDHTRPVPSRDILPNMLQDLKAGSPDIAVTLLVATGFHRGTTEQELEQKLGKELMNECRIVVHDCRDTKNNVKIGTLPSGAPLIIDREAVETDLLISEGFIEPHFFAGFSGGRKSVLPGICDEKTVLGNHCSAFIDSPYSRTGILKDNPIHTDMIAAARMAKLAFIVNVVLDEDKKTVAAFAGDFEQAHLAGCEFLMPYAQVPAAPADVVVTSNGGAPLDQNIYQCVKSLTAAEATCREGGTIIECAECADGHGGEGFFNSFATHTDPESLYRDIMATPQDQTIPDQWESQVLARVLMHHPVIFVTRPELKEVVETMFMTYASSLEEAMEMANPKGDCAVTVIPDGVSVIVTGAEENNPA